MIFRPYRPSDIDAVLALFRSNIPKYFMLTEEAELRDFLSKETVDYYVIEIDNEIVGAGGIGLNDDRTVSLCWGMVRNDLIGTGLGRKLTEFRIERSMEKFGKLPLVISTSHYTEGFYEKFGFETFKRIPDGFGPGIDTCKMRREANASVGV